MRANGQADYSSDPNLSFRPISLNIVADILNDELLSDEQLSNEDVAERLAEFEKKLRIPIPNINPDNQGGKQVIILPPDSEEIAVDGNEDEDNEEDGNEENEGDKIVFEEDDTPSTSYPDTDNQPDVLDPGDDPPGNSGDAPGQNNDEEPPGQSEESPGNSGEAPGQN